VLDDRGTVRPELPPGGQSGANHPKNEVVWLPAALALLAFQALVLVHGLSGHLPVDVQDVYLWGLAMVAGSVVLLVMAIVLGSHLSGSIALVALALAVAADIFVATCAATGAIPFAATLAVLIVAIWGAVWSITEPRSAL
jgi:hypothetical protein